MNKYTELRNQVANLEAQKEAASKYASTGLLIGFLLAGISLLMLVFASGPSDTWFSLGLLMAFLGVVVVVASRIFSRSQVRKLSEQIESVKSELTPLEGRRSSLLEKIKEGNLDILPSMTDYVFQKLPIALLPSEEQLAFRPQKGEVCFAQIGDVNLGRLQTRTETRKTGGGYRIGKVYVPVQKERIRITEMKTLDRGILAVTNCRVLYLGAVRKLPVKFDKILELQAYQDALAVTKEGRQSADLFFPVDGELLGAIIEGIENCT